MLKIGIIAEYNPFHNGHLYQINEIKNKYNPNLLVSVTSGNYTQRGDFSSIDKFNKARIGINNGLDLVLELPLIYSIQSADFFSYYSVYILNMLKVDMIIAGSESNDINYLYTLSNLLDDDSFNESIKSKLSLGFSYKKAINLSLNDLGYDNLGPNDILNVCYIRAINKINKNIKFDIIKRTISYTSDTPNNSYASASYLRETKSLDGLTPIDTLEYYNNYGFNSIKKYIDIIKYSIINNDLKTIHNMDEGLDNYIRKLDLTQFNLNINSKRYTTSRINRLLISILLDIKKTNLTEPNYLRVLSMNNEGRKYLNSIKHDVTIYTNVKNNLHPYIDLEIKGSRIYSLNSKIDTFKYEFNNPYICINK